MTQIVNQAATATALESAPNPHGFRPVRNVHGDGHGQCAGVGDADWCGYLQRWNGTVRARAPWHAVCVATLTTGSLAVGSHTITATYGGDASFAGSVATAVTQSVSQASTTMAVASVPNPSLAQTAVAFTAALSVTVPGSRRPQRGHHLHGGQHGLYGYPGRRRCYGGCRHAELGAPPVSAAYDGDASFLGTTTGGATRW